MSFFIRNSSRKKSQAKRKVNSSRKKKLGGDEPDLKRKKHNINDEEIESDVDSDYGTPGKAAGYSSDSEDEETAQEKKLRLAKEYLAQIHAEEAESDDDDDATKDIVSHRLKQDILESSGKLHKDVADDYLPPGSQDIKVLRGHQLPVTCVVISSDGKYIFSGSKDCSIIKWSVELGKKVHVIPGGRKGTENKHIGHTNHVLCIAISSDGKYLASGDRNKLIHIWNPDTCQLLHTFRGHRDAVSGVTFRKGTHQLFSASHDRSVKIWTCDEMAYVETLFGHQDIITGMDSLMRERAITCGGRDGSLRIWKVVEESQLVFHGHRGSVDCVCLIDEEHFVSGADDNSIALWHVMKKRPLVTVNKAHSCEEGTADKLTQSENWVSCVTALQHTDLIASGSKDGCIRLWKCGKNFKEVQPLFTIPITGFVNSLKFSSQGDFLVAGVGQEHRLGRWWRIKEAKNSICIINLNKKTDSNHVGPQTLRRDR